MRIDLAVDSFAALTKSVGSEIAQAATAAMRDTTPDTKRELREQIMSAGLGQRLANTWRDRVYPQGGKSVTPTGYIWSNAPDIVDSFVRGATIVPVNGRRFLAIPTESVPLQRGSRGKRKRMSPEEVEHHFNQDLFYLRGRNGRVLAFLNVTRARRKSAGGFRQDTKGRRKQGRDAERVLMFVLVPSVRMPKMLDLDGPVQRWTTRFAVAFSQRLEG